MQHFYKSIWNCGSFNNTRVPHEIYFEVLQFLIKVSSFRDVQFKAGRSNQTASFMQQSRYFIRGRWLSFSPNNVYLIWGCLQPLLFPTPFILRTFLRSLPQTGCSPRTIIIIWMGFLNRIWGACLSHFICIINFFANFHFEFRTRKETANLLASYLPSNTYRYAERVPFSKIIIIRAYIT